MTDICALVTMNRTTFYAIYDSAHDLAQHQEGDFLWLLQHIERNRPLYEAYFKCCQQDIEVSYTECGDRNKSVYYQAFFVSGLHILLKLWVENGCDESPEIINALLKNEYKKLNSRIHCFNSTAINEEKT